LPNTTSAGLGRPHLRLVSQMAGQLFFRPSLSSPPRPSGPCPWACCLSGGADGQASADGRSDRRQSAQRYAG